MFTDYVVKPIIDAKGENTADLIMVMQQMSETIDNAALSSNSEEIDELLEAQMSRTKGVVAIFSREHGF